MAWYQHQENTYFNDIYEGIYYSSEKERIKIIRNLEMQRKKDWSIRDIQVHSDKNVITFIHKNDFRLN